MARLADVAEEGLDYRRMAAAYRAIADGNVGRTYEQDYCRTQADIADRIAEMQEAAG